MKKTKTPIIPITGRPQEVVYRLHKVTNADLKRVYEKLRKRSYREALDLTDHYSYVAGVRDALNEVAVMEENRL